VHLEYFGTQAAIAEEKGRLVEALPADGLAVLNADDAFTSRLREKTNAHVETFGVEAGDLRVEDYRAGADGSATCKVAGSSVRLRMGGRHQATNAAAALLVGRFAGVSIADGAAQLSQVEVPHRLQRVRLWDGVELIDDAYNASPESMLAAFDAVADLNAQRRLAVLGEMRELGPAAEPAHVAVGKRAAEVFDEVCVVDVGNGRTLAESAGAFLAPDKQAAVDWVRQRAKPGSVVLVKASRGVALDQVVDALAGDGSRA
jgi:UDP-N-acetylmuramoyl-tripeptide--D-alanyl-D-alanine ligase